MPFGWPRFFAALRMTFFEVTQRSLFTGMTEKNGRGRGGPTRWSYVRFYGRPAAEEVEVTAVLRL